MSNNCSAPFHLPERCFFQQDWRLGREPGNAAEAENLGTISGPRSSLAVAFPWSGFRQGRRSPFQYSPSRPASSALSCPLRALLSQEKIARPTQTTAAVAKDRCSSNRDAFHPSAWALAQFQPTEPLRTSLAHIVLSAGLETRESASLARDSQRFFKPGNGSRPNALAIFRQSCPPIPGMRSNSGVG